MQKKLAQVEGDRPEDREKDEMAAWFPKKEHLEKRTYGMSTCGGRKGEGSLEKGDGKFKGEGRRRKLKQEQICWAKEGALRL